jgi:hypothetical protein
MSQPKAGTLVASPAIRPSTTASLDRKGPESASRIGTNAIHATGHNEKSRKLAATASPPTKASALRVASLRGASDAAPVERAGAGAGSTKRRQLRGSVWGRSRHSRSNVGGTPGAVLCDRGDRLPILRLLGEPAVRPSHRPHQRVRATEAVAYARHECDLPLENAHVRSPLRAFPAP